MNLASRVRMLLSAAAVCTAVLSAYPAAADPIDTSLMVSIDILNGNHETGDGQVAHFAALPLPIGELVVRHDRDAIRIEGLPPLAFSYNDIDGPTTTRLSIVNATYRRTIGDGWYIGAGETAYNQTSAFSGNETQASRVTGARYEVGRDWHTRVGSVEFGFALNPVMHGPILTTFHFNNGFEYAITNPEHAAQVDALLRASTRVSRHAELVYGVRYINLTSRYDQAPGILADRDVGIAPSVGYRVRL